MRRICHVLLSALLAAGPWSASAQEEATETPKEKSIKAAPKADQVVTPRRRRHRRSKEEEQEVERASGVKPKAESDAPVAAAPVAPVEPDEDSGPSLTELLGKRLPPHRYLYIAGGLLIATGLVFAYSAQGQAKRADTITSSLEAQRAVSSAQAAAGTANVMYVLGGASLLVALILELLPEPAADKANLTFHF